MTADLVVFLRARLAEDEQTAREATPGPWAVNEGSYAQTIFGADGRAVVAGSRWPDGSEVFDNEDARHIARWNPARVLAEVDAKRRLLSLHAAAPSAADGPADPPVTVCRECGPDTHALWECDPSGTGGDWYPCATLRLLALPYREYPDYQPEWAPGE